MNILIDRASDEPVYVQIARQIRDAIVRGRLPAGRLLPSVRTLASDMGLNLNTVARAYRLMEEQGFVRIRDRSGVEVAPPRAASTAESRSRLRAELRELLARMRQAGLSGAELREAVSAELERVGFRQPGGRQGGSHD